MPHPFFTQFCIFYLRRFIYKSTPNLKIVATPISEIFYRSQNLKIRSIRFYRPILSADFLGEIRTNFYCWIYLCRCD